MKIQIKAIQSGKMDKGDYFCYEDAIYIADKSELDGEDHFEVQDELWNEPFWVTHGMDQEFFDEYFVEVKTERDIYYKKDLSLNRNHYLKEI